MIALSRVLEFGGIVVVGIGLIFGVARNDMANEMLFAVVGFAMFVAGRMMRR